MILKNIKIEKVVFRGLGLGFDADGAIFVNSAYPGDILDLQVFRQKKNTRFAEISKIVEASPLRRQANCEVFGDCGGCDWLDINYSDQLALKQEIVGEVFAQQGEINAIIGSAQTEHYRNKSFMPLARQAGEIRIGMFQKRSHFVVAHQNCQIQPQIFDQIASEFMAYVKASKIKIYDEKTGKGNLRHLGFRINNNQAQVLVILVTKNRKLPFSRQLVSTLTQKFPQISGIIQNINPEAGNVILGGSEKILFGSEYLQDKIGEIEYRLHYRSFFQINHDTTEKLYNYLAQQIEVSEVIIDAYCGVGTIGLYLAAKAAQIYGIESNAAAVSDAQYNQELNNLQNCQFQVGLVEDKLQEICQTQQIDSIIFDPPRKGLDAKIIDILAQQKIAKIIYVSCNPMTQKRDLELLLKLGYQLESIQPFDMFPQTWHIENVLVLRQDADE
ncbi:MAG: 23S rRNA (uracil(1939)-C(5))-methyltransferase RlmD [Candidatus Cloacimonadales bacterium]